MKIIKTILFYFLIFYALCLAFYMLSSDNTADKNPLTDQGIGSTDSPKKEFKFKIHKQVPAHIRSEKKRPKIIKKVQSKYSNLSPGGAGWVMHACVHPDDKQIMFICNDIGGAWRTLDGGKTFKNVSKDLTSGQTEKIVCVPSSRIVYIATSDGVYKSHDLGDSWALMENGMEHADHEFTHPVLDIAVAANDPETVWATIGEMVTPEYRDSDPYAVYFSDDQAETWKGVLYLDTTQAKGKLDNINVTIAVDPIDPEKVLVGTSIGLFSTPDSGLTWYELGNEHISVSRDRGHSWDDCHDNPICPAQYRKNVCSSLDSCLPVVSHVGLKHVSLSDVAIFNDGKSRILYALVKEQSHLFDDTCNRYKETDNDKAITGGPYLSLDNGMSWKSYFRAKDGSCLSNLMRCNENTEFFWNSTIYHDIAVSPKDPYHFFLAAGFLSGGVYEHLDGTWIYHADSSICPGANGSCYEGQRSQGLWADQHGPATKKISIVDWEKDRPDYVLGHAHGALFASFNEHLKRYEYDHIEQNVDTDCSDCWQTTGMSNFCAMDMVWPGKDEHVFIVGGLDSGLVKTENGGKSWKLLKVEDLNQTDESLCIVKDEQTKVLYASVTENGTSIIKSSNGGETWQVIGGDCDNCDTDLGFAKDVETFSLAVDYNSPAANRKVYAATSKGLYVYDPVNSQLQWQLFRDPEFPFAGIEARDVFTSVKYPEFILVSACDKALNAQTEEEKNEIFYGGKFSHLSGVYLLRHLEDKLTCTKLIGGKNPLLPSVLALAGSQDNKLSLIVAGRFDLQPVVYQTQFDLSMPEQVSWQIVLDENMLKKMTGYKPVGNYFYNNFRTIAVSPSEPEKVYIGMGTEPFYDHYKFQQTFVSHDSGKTFKIAAQLEDFHNKNFSMLKFNPKGDRLFMAPGCSGLYSLNFNCF